MRKFLWFPDAIATLVAVVIPVKNSTGMQSSALDSIQGELEEAVPLTVNASSFSGGTLILNAGAITVELALVDLPENLQDLTRADFTCQSFDVAGDAFDQDIVCQLLAKNETWGMSVDLPRPGHPDLPSRYQLQQRLQGSAFGLQLLEAARHLKVILQHQESFVLDIGATALGCEAPRFGKFGFSAFFAAVESSIECFAQPCGNVAGGD